MKKWISRIFWIPIAVLVVAFLFANRQTVAISLDPFSVENPALATPEFYLWVWLVLMLLIGVALGSAGAWISARPTRVKARGEHRELKALRKEIAELRSRLDQPDTTPPSGELPVLEAQSAP